MKPPKFVAEIGNNHQGDYNIAERMCSILCHSGVWGVKSQMRDINSHPEWKDRLYINEHSFGKTYYDHRVVLELSLSEHQDLYNYCKGKGVEYFCSVWDLASVRNLRSVGCNIVKIPSCYATWTRLLDECKDEFDTIIISTGMTSLEELIGIASWCNESVKTKQIIVMLCTSAYPCSVKDVHLSLIHTYRDLFSPDISLGISGHYKGRCIDYGAYGMGFEYIERHVTMNCDWKGSDHAASMEIGEIMSHIRALNKIYDSYGDPLFEKQVLPCEIKPREKLRDKEGDDE